MSIELVGSWSLEACEEFDASGTVTRHPMGERPVGQITYTADGHMSATLAHGERAAFGQSPATTSEQQWAAAAKRFAGYAGTYERDGDTVHHHVRVALVPDWHGTTLTRAISERDGKLVLTVVKDTDDGGPRQRLVWAKSEDD